MNWQYWEFAILALCIWREARSEGEDGMRAVGHVAWNRHKTSGKTLAEVICQDAQFTSINPPKKSYDPQLDVYPAYMDAMFRKAMTIANEIRDGNSVDPTQGSTHYWNAKWGTSESFQRGIAEGSLIPTGKIGQHDFYKEIKLLKV